VQQYHHPSNTNLNMEFNDDVGKGVRNHDGVEASSPLLSD